MLHYARYPIRGMDLGYDAGYRIRCHVQSDDVRSN